MRLWIGAITFKIQISTRGSTLNPNRFAGERECCLGPRFRPELLALLLDHSNSICVEKMSDRDKLQVHFVIYSLIPSFSTKKVEIFTRSLQVNTRYVCKKVQIHCLNRALNACMMQQNAGNFQMTPKYHIILFTYKVLRNTIISSAAWTNVHSNQNHKYLFMFVLCIFMIVKYLWATSLRRHRPQNAAPVVFLFDRRTKTHP